jgi:hypothetical protein
MNEFAQLREDRYAELRNALAGSDPGYVHPTSGSWRVHIGKVPDGCYRVASFGTAQEVEQGWTDEDAEVHVIADECGYAMPAEDDAAFVAAADPATIAELLAERDRLRGACEEIRVLFNKAHAQGQEAEADARRYRYWREQLMGADFDYGVDGGSASVLVFALPDGAAVSANLDATTDAMIAALATQEQP